LRIDRNRAAAPVIAIAWTLAKPKEFTSDCGLIIVFLFENKGPADRQMALQPDDRLALDFVML
jgi:hypothetical protein